MSSAALSLPVSTTGPRGSSGRTDVAIARRAEVPGNGIDWNEIRSICSAAIKAGILPKAIQREEQAVAIALKGRELGIPPMQAFSQIHMIQGVASCSAQLMLALAYRHLPEFDLQVIESTSAKATLELRRDARRSPVRLTYTIEQAKNAGLTGKDNWRNHPDDMLRNRVVAKGLRLVAPDVFAGLYLPDEVESGAHMEASEVVPMEIPSSPRRIVAEAPVEPPRDAETAPPVVPEQSPAPQPTASAPPATEAWNRDRVLDYLSDSRNRAATKAEAARLGKAINTGADLRALDDDTLAVLETRVFDAMTPFDERTPEEPTK